jgi:hypothetical protein
LQQANYLQRQMLYLRVADADDLQVFKVFPIGPLVSFSKPEAVVDKQSNVHVLSQTGGWSFIYIVTSPQGTVLVRQRYEYTDTRPVLRVNKAGKVLVVGGNRRVTSEDLPPPVVERSTNNVPEPKP